MAEPALQYDMFYTPTETDLVRAEIEALRDSQNRVRRKTFGMINELTRLLIRTQKENDELRRLLLKRVK